MAIVRQPSLGLEEWQAAVRAQAGVRLLGADVLTPLPDGQVLRIKHGPGDVEVFFDGDWHPSIRFQGGAAHLRAVFLHLEHPIGRAAKALAERLGAGFRLEGEPIEL